MTVKGYQYLSNGCIFPRKENISRLWEEAVNLFSAWSNFQTYRCLHRMYPQWKILKILYLKMFHLLFIYIFIEINHILPIKKTVV